MQLTPHTGTETVPNSSPVILQLMQLTPHTGTETTGHGIVRLNRHDATHTPHGDGNASIAYCVCEFIKDATHTPHGDGNT